MHHFQQSNFMPSSSQVPFTPGVADLRPNRARTESENLSSYSVIHVSYNFDFPVLMEPTPEPGFLKLFNPLKRFFLLQK